MNSAAFLSAVKQEIARLQQIQSLLENESTNVTSASATKPISGKRGGMSEAGKARVAEAQRKRWAAKKADTAAAQAPASSAKGGKAAAPAAENSRPALSSRKASPAKKTAATVAGQVQSAKKAVGPVKSPTRRDVPAPVTRTSASQSKERSAQAKQAEIGVSGTKKRVSKDRMPQPAERKEVAGTADVAFSNAATAATSNEVDTAIAT